MNIMKYMLCIICIIIVFNYYYLQTSNTDITSSNVSSNSLGFVKPQHRLHKIFSKISSGYKLKLHGKYKQYFYTKNTINATTKEYIINILKNMIKTITHISNQEYFIKNIENVYCLTGRNQRFIIDFFLYDVKNYYTIRILSDIVIIDDVIYINYVNTQGASNPTLLNKYDVKFNSSGILFNSDMFHENIEMLLNKYYKTNYNVISIDNDTSLEYTNVDLSKVYNMNSLKNLYFPTTFSNKTLEDYNNKGLSGLNEKFLPSNQLTINSQEICNNESCVLKNTSTQNIINEPYNAPGVLYNRSSNDKYKWLKNPSGTIYNLL